MASVIIQGAQSEFRLRSFILQWAFDKSRVCIYDISKYDQGGVISARFETMDHAISMDKVSIEYPDVIISALNYYAYRNIDFVDGMIILRARLHDEKVLTFDKKLNRLIEE